MMPGASQLQDEFEDGRPTGPEPLASDSLYRAACCALPGAFYLLDCVRDGNGQIVDFCLRDVNQRGLELFLAWPGRN
jgi:hypothetical protein